MDTLTRRTPKRKPPPISLNDHSQLLLRGLAGSLGFEHLLAAHVNFDLPWLCLGLLCGPDLQHPLVIVRAHLPRIHGAGQGERAGKASVLPLDATEVLLFL